MTDQVVNRVLDLVTFLLGIGCIVAGYMVEGLSVLMALGGVLTGLPIKQPSRVANAIRKSRTALKDMPKP